MSQRSPSTKSEYSRKWYQEKRKSPEFLEARKQKHLQQYQKHLDNRLLISARYRSKNSGLEFDLERSDIKIPDRCPILKVPLTHNTEYAASLDRIDNSKGYVKGNVQVISRRANLMKNAATLEDLRNFGDWIRREYGSEEDIEY